MENPFEKKTASERVADFAECLRHAHSQGRPIIPIVGAGISAESGFPVIATIIRYFGKLQRTIDEGAWLGPFRELDKITSIKSLVGHYKAHPWDYVSDFGWPDRFQLTEDMHVCRPNDMQDAQFMDTKVAKGLETLIRRTDRKRCEEFDDLREKLKSKFDLVLDESGKSVAWELLGDWRRMILGFTDYRNDFADALLARFALGRAPNLAHRYLAFLVRRLGVSVVFTMNFDPFIEEALEDLDLRPRTFAMERGRMLPNSDLVLGQLAVVKMHGSTHALLLDEQLDRPLRNEYLETFGRIIGSEPLVVVIGCSGEDRRLCDLLGQVGEKGEVAWLHYGSEPPKFQVTTAAQRRYLMVPTAHVGATLHHVFSEIYRRHPVSRVPYLIHFQQPMLPPLLLAEADGTEPKDEQIRASVRGLVKDLEHPKRCILIETIFDPTASDEVFTETTASRQLLLAGRYLPSGFNLIWVDLEAVHTIAAVAGSIIDQCRKYDTALAPCVLAIEEENEDLVKRAVARVERALKRSRYCVFFDGLETYTWSPTAHHGETHSAFYDQREARLSFLTKFLESLGKEIVSGESRLYLSIDRSRNRTVTAVPHPKLEDMLQKNTKVLENAGWQSGEPLNPRPLAYADFFVREVKTKLAMPKEWRKPDQCSAPWSWAFALSILATYRRTRPLALVYHVLEPVLGGPKLSEAFLTEMALEKPDRPALCWRIEGGGIWFHREIRDYVYTANTCDTGADAMRDRIENRGDFGSTLYQLLINAFLHQWAARSWYAKAYVQSRDTYALLEYFYHRLANVRSLTKLVGLVERADANETAIQQVMKGWRQFQSVVKKIDETADKSGASEGVRGAAKVAEAFELQNCDVGPTKSYNEPMAFLAALQNEFEGRRREGLTRWRLIWERSESSLRSQVPAEQLIRLCEQLLRDDLKVRCSKLITGYDGKGTPVTTPIRCLSTSANALPLRVLTAYVERFKMKVAMDRSDYGCKSPAPNKIRRGQSYSSHKTQRLTPTSVHAEIDEIQCKFRSQLEEVDKIGTKEMAATIQGYVEKLDAIEAAERDSYEFDLRKVHVKTNLAFGRVSIFSHEGFSGTWRAGIVGFRDEALSRCEEGLRLMRRQGRTSEMTPQSAIVEPASDGTLYFPYRAIFTIQRARGRWMQRFKAMEGPTEIRTLAEGMETALGEFDDARAGLTDANALLLALADLYAGECCIAHARIALNNDWPNADTKLALSPSQLAENCYSTARGFLLRAQNSLIHSARNVVWLRLFFQLTAQYQADRLHASLLELLAGARSFADCQSLKVGSQLGRIAKGFESLRNGLDLYLDKSQPAKTAWLRRIERKLTLNGFCGAVFVLCLKERTVDKTQIADLWSGFKETRKRYVPELSGAHSTSEVDYKLVKDLRELAQRNLRHKGSATAKMKELQKTIRDTLRATVSETSVRA
jgi:hypothetical protein